MVRLIVFSQPHLAPIPLTRASRLAGICATNVVDIAVGNGATARL